MIKYVAGDLFIYGGGVDRPPSGEWKPSFMFIWALSHPPPRMEWADSIQNKWELLYCQYGIATIKWVKQLKIDCHARFKWSKFELSDARWEQGTRRELLHLREVLNFKALEGAGVPIESKSACCRTSPAADLGSGGWLPHVEPGNYFRILVGIWYVEFWRLRQAWGVPSALQGALKP